MEAAGVPLTTDKPPFGGARPSVRLGADVREVLDRIVTLACHVAEADEAAVLVPDIREPGRLVAVAGCAGAGGTLTGAWRDDEGAVGRAMRTGAAAVAGEADGRLRAAVPLAWGGARRGALLAESLPPRRRFGRVQLTLLGELAQVASSAFEHEEASARLEAALGDSVALLARAVDLRDLYTGRHSRDVEALARSVGVRLGFAGEALAELELAARLHDVGKLTVPDAILGKPGPLEEHEWCVMRDHAAVGGRMLAGVPGLARVAELVRAHHERWDGHGYPDGLAGEEIPLASRVIAACDAYGAMISERPYRPAMPPHSALEELADGAGTQFDPAVVAAVVSQCAN